MCVRALPPPPPCLLRLLLCIALHRTPFVPLCLLQVRKRQPTGANPHQFLPRGRVLCLLRVVQGKGGNSNPVCGLILDSLPLLLPHLLHLRHLPHLRPLYSRKAGIRTLGLSLGNTVRGRTGLGVWKRRSAGGLNLPEQIFQKRRWSFSAN